MRKLKFRNMLFNFTFRSIKKKPLVSYVYTPLNRLKPSMVNTSQRLTQIRMLTSLASNEPVLQFSWMTMLYSFFGIPLGVYIYKVWYVNCNSILLLNVTNQLKKKELFFFYLT